MLARLIQEGIEPIQKEISALRGDEGKAAEVEKLERRMLALQEKIPPLFESYTTRTVWPKLQKAVGRYERKQKLLEKLREKPASATLRGALDKVNKKLNGYRGLEENLAAIRALKATDPKFFDQVWSLAKKVFDSETYVNLERALKQAWDSSDLTVESDANEQASTGGSPHGGAGRRGGGEYATAESMHGILSGLSIAPPSDRSGPGRG